ncbi:MAG: hypothetical protein WD851_00765 [Pirellulales bacterium]
MEDDSCGCGGTATELATDSVTASRANIERVAQENGIKLAPPEGNEVACVV